MGGEISIPVGQACETKSTKSFIQLKNRNGFKINTTACNDIITLSDVTTYLIDLWPTEVASFSYFISPTSTTYTVSEKELKSIANGTIYLHLFHGHILIQRYLPRVIFSLGRLPDYIFTVSMNVSNSFNNMERTSVYVEFAKNKEKIVLTYFTLYHNFTFDLQHRLYDFAAKITSGGGYVILNVSRTIWTTIKFDKLWKKVKWADIEGSTRKDPTPIFHQEQSRNGNHQCELTSAVSIQCYQQPIKSEGCQYGQRKQCAHNKKTGSAYGPDWWKP